MPLLPRVEQVVGVDVSRDMVNFASKNFEHNSLSFHQLDIERAVQPRQAFPDGFSKVCLIAVIMLEHGGIMGGHTI